MPVDEQVQQVLECYASFGAQPLETLSPQDARRRPTIVDAVHTLRLRRGEVVGAEVVGAVRDEVIQGPGGELRVRIYRPDAGGPFPVLLYFHDGGWVLGDLDRCDATCRALTNLVRCLVVSVDYRLAPEHLFPAAVQDAFTATQWAAASAKTLGGDPTRVAVAGEGAGGNLAAVVAQMGRDSQAFRLIYQALVYPFMDYRFDTLSYQHHAYVRPLTKREMRWFWSHYLPSAAAGANCYASPLRAEDLSDLPPGLVLTAEYDVVRDEGEAYGRRLEEAGVPTVVRRWAGMTHGFLAMAPVVERAQEGLLELANWLGVAFGEQPRGARAEEAAAGERGPEDEMVGQARLREDAERARMVPARAAEEAGGVPEAAGGVAGTPLEGGPVVRVGMEVVGADGQRVGKVKAVRASDFVVDRRFRPDVTLPFQAVHVAGDRVILDAAAKDATGMDWSHFAL